MWYLHRVRRAWQSIAAGLLAAGCSRSVDLGSDVIWSTDFEKGDLSDWSAGPGTGGFYPNDGGSSETSIEISDVYHHSGRYSVKVSSMANVPDPGVLPASGGGLYKQGLYPEAAYYSAWYFLPRPYQTTTSWIILKFKGVVSGDAGIVPGYAELLDLSLESLPGGGMTLVLSDAQHQYLTSPLPDPVPLVPIKQWFQIESFYRNSQDASGGLTIWLDGVLIYDVMRPTGPNPMVYFSPCSIVYQLDPPTAEIYVDDVAISWTRVTPHGILRAP